MRHPERHSKAVMHDFCIRRNFARPATRPICPNLAERLQIHSRFHRLRRVAESKFRKRNPLVFYSADFTTCQGCHMKRNAADAAGLRAPRITLASHRWLAGNTAVPFYYGFDEQLKKTIEFLRTGNYLNVDIFAIKKGIAMTKADRAAGQGAFHSLAPTTGRDHGRHPEQEHRPLADSRSARSLRGLGRVHVKDAAARRSITAASSSPTALLDPRAHSFTNRPVNTDDSEFVDNHKVWTIHSVAYDNTVQAGRSVLVRYQFRIPADARAR
jgi:hypothetical protein